MPAARERFDDHVSRGDYKSACKELHVVSKPLFAITALSSSARARALDDHRALSAALASALDTMRCVAWAPANVAAAANAVRLIGASEEGRSTVGKNGGISTLLAAWRMQPKCLELVEALMVLCSGHLDNVSRFMREDGIEQAISLWSAGDVDPLLKKQALILVGICCVCLPDENHGSTLIPAVLAALTQAIKHSREGRSRQIAIAAMCLLANVGEARSKELREAARTGEPALPGYDVADGPAVVEQLIAAWDKWPKDREVVSAATWALCGLYRAHLIDLFSSKEASTIRREIAELLSLNRLRASTIDTIGAIIQGRYEHRRALYEKMTCGLEDREGTTTEIAVGGGPTAEAGLAADLEVEKNNMDGEDVEKESENSELSTRDGYIEINMDDRGEDDDVEEVDVEGSDDNAPCTVVYRLTAADSEKGEGDDDDPSSSGEGGESEDEVDAEEREEPQEAEEAEEIELSLGQRKNRRCENYAKHSHEEGEVEGIEVEASHTESDVRGGPEEFEDDAQAEEEDDEDNSDEMEDDDEEALPIVAYHHHQSPLPPLDESTVTGLDVIMTPSPRNPLKGKLCIAYVNAANPLPSKRRRTTPKSPPF
jgi:hypothetical protein